MVRPGKTELRICLLEEAASVFESSSTSFLTRLTFCMYDGNNVIQREEIKKIKTFIISKKS